MLLSGKHTNRMKLLARLYKFFDNPRTQKISLIAALTVTFILIFLLNRLYPLFAEDWDYRFIWEWEGREPNKVNNLWDIIQSQYNHYMLWGGRAIVHAIDQLLLMFNPFWSDLLNSVVFVGFAYMIYKIANINNSTNVFILILAALGIWLAQPAFPTTVLWLTGRANDLWGTLIIILFIYPFCRYYHKQNTPANIVKTVYLFLGGIIAGWTNENMSIALILFIITLLIIMKYEKIPIPAWAISGLIGAIIGCGFLLLAPGNYARLAYTTQGEEASLISSFGFRMEVLYNHFKNYLLLPCFIYGALLLIYIKNTSRRKRKKVLTISLLFLAVAIIAHLAMIATPMYPQRALFGIISFIIIAILILYANIELKSNVFRLCNLFVILIFTGFFSLDYYRDFRYLKLVDKFWEQRTTFVEEQKEKGVKDIVFEDHFDIYKTNFEFYDFSSFTDNWVNNAYARYHGVNSVRVKSQDEK